MIGLGQAVFNAMGLTTPVKPMDHIPGCRPVPIARRERKLDTVIGQDRVDFVRNSLNQLFKNLFTIF